MHIDGATFFDLHPGDVAAECCGVRVRISAQPLGVKRKRPPDLKPVAVAAHNRPPMRRGTIGWTVVLCCTLCRWSYAAEMNTPTTQSAVPADLARQHPEWAFDHGGVVRGDSSK